MYIGRVGRSAYYDMLCLPQYTFMVFPCIIANHDPSGKANVRFTFFFIFFFKHTLFLLFKPQIKSLRT